MIIVVFRNTHKRFRVRSALIKFSKQLIATLFISIMFWENKNFVSAIGVLRVIEQTTYQYLILGETYQKISKDWRFSSILLISSRLFVTSNRIFTLTLILIYLRDDGKISFGNFYTKCFVYNRNKMKAGRGGISWTVLKIAKNERQKDELCIQR